MTEHRQRFRNLTNGSKIGALFLIALGIYFLLRNFGLIPDGWDIGQLWPLILIVPGILVLLRDKKQ